jgi:hypothetical protein
LEEQQQGKGTLGILEVLTHRDHMLTVNLHFGQEEIMVIEVDQVQHLKQTEQQIVHGIWVMTVGMLTQLVSVIRMEIAQYQEQRKLNHFQVITRLGR